jgi:hypothetical protein
MICSILKKYINIEAKIGFGNYENEVFVILIVEKKPVIIGIYMFLDTSLRSV